MRRAAQDCCGGVLAEPFVGGAELFPSTVSIFYVYMIAWEVSYFAVVGKRMKHFNHEVARSMASSMSYAGWLNIQSGDVPRVIPD